MLFMPPNYGSLPVNHITIYKSNWFTLLCTLSPKVSIGELSITFDLRLTSFRSHLQAFLVAKRVLSPYLTGYFGKLAQ